MILSKLAGARKICLVVDNPLRDLDGLVLLARQLALLDCEVWLVPMYDQAFDVYAIDADFVLLNYVRSNNKQHLMNYLMDGRGVGVLDTEGAGGKNADEFAQLVNQAGAAHLVDLYFTWGPSQKQALVNQKVVAAEKVHVSGCPRYDFCALPWRHSLEKPAIEGSYVLVNTNFPIVNPRFSEGSGAELKAMLAAGFDEVFANQYIKDAKQAHAGIIDMLNQLLPALPDTQFVLRPHPFEASDSYASLNKFGNFQIRQEGTSVQWLNSATALVHLNCSTAVEAVMLGKPAISPAWLNTTALEVPGPHSVSAHCRNIVDLIGTLQDAVAHPEGYGATAVSESWPLYGIYYKIDGKACERIASQIVSDANNAVSVSAPSLVVLSIKQRLIRGARRLLGYRLSNVMQTRIDDQQTEQKRRNKRFESAKVQKLLDEIANAADPRAPLVKAFGMPFVKVQRPRQASGQSVCIKKC